MLQRIQTVYLLLFIVCSMVLCFLPLFELTAFDGLYVLGVIKTSFSGASGSAVLSYNFPLMVILSLMILLALAIIFKYNNRNLQMKLIFICMVLLILFSAILCFNYFQLAGLSTADHSIKISWILAILPVQMVLLWLANGGIRKDEALVRSADRLR